MGRGFSDILRGAWHAAEYAQGPGWPDHRCGETSRKSAPGKIERAGESRKPDAGIALEPSRLDLFRPYSPPANRPPPSQPPLKSRMQIQTAKSVRDQELRGLDRFKTSNTEGRQYESPVIEREIIPTVSCLSKRGAREPSLCYSASWKSAR